MDISRKRDNSLIIYLLFISLWSCSQLGEKQNTKEIKEIIKSREIKQVSEPKILDRAMEIGEVLADSSQSALAARLLASISLVGIQESVEYCRFVATPLIDSLSTEFNARIRRTSLRLRNKSNKPDNLERQVLEAYQYASDNELPMTSTAQVTEDGKSVLFTKPILLNSPVCLSSHGTIGTEILEEDYRTIEALYDSDSAVDYQLDDISGMWSITLDKKSIVNDL